MAILLDANVLIALVVSGHVHHDTAEEWFDSTNDPIATCPITQGSLMRLLVREGASASSAQKALIEFTSTERHVFWQDAVPYSEVSLHGVLGHRQLTDAYLAQLARAHGGRLVTFDQGLAQLHPDVADFLPSIPPQAR